MTRLTQLVLPGVGLLLLQACQGPNEPVDIPPPVDVPEAGDAKLIDAGFVVTPEARAARARAIPMDVDGQWESTNAYLLDRYDIDGDGEISAEEYPRGETAFTRLDRNKDGVLSDADWVRSDDGRDQSARRERMRQMAATMTIGQYFQSDEDPTKLSIDEMEDAAILYDTDENGVVSEDEFTCAYEGREQELPDSMGMGRMLGDTPPWELISVVDADGDGAIAILELVAFFENTDSNSDGVLTFGQPARRSGGRARSAGGESPSGAAEGALAPDFTLTSPDGSSRVTLSSFAGSKPVALIFGSYT